MKTLLLASQIVLSELRKLPLARLYIDKMVTTQRLGLYVTIKHGLFALMTVTFAHIAKLILDPEPLQWTVVEFIALLMGIQALIGYIYMDFIVAKLTARKEMINDLIALKASLTSKAG